MDILYFLDRRISFIRQFYATASTPYVECKQKIEAKEKPFIPLCCDDAEPAFLFEWLEADESIHVLAYSCISMLAATLHLYLKTWVTKSGISVDESLKNTFTKTGWFNGYRIHFLNCFAVDFKTCPRNLDLLEEVILSRNRIEHPASITNMMASYTNKDLQKLPHLFFINENEADLIIDAEENELLWFIPPTLYITERQLIKAIDEVKGFAEWFESEIRKSLC